MADEKKSQPNTSWAKMENAMSTIGKWAWLIAIGGAASLLVFAIPALVSYKLNSDLALYYSSPPHEIPYYV
jgi:hypothetical protein